MCFWQGLWQALNSPVVIAFLVSGVLIFMGSLISNRHTERRVMKSIQTSVMNRFNEAATHHLLNIERPNQMTYLEDFKRSSRELRTVVSMTLVVFPSKKIITGFTDFLDIADDFANEIIKNSGKGLRDLSKNRKYLKAVMIVGTVLGEMCKELGFPLMKFKALAAELIEEFEKSGYHMH